jgi:hypothetical protein
MNQDRYEYLCNNREYELGRKLSYNEREEIRKELRVEEDRDGAIALIIVFIMFIGLAIWLGPKIYNKATEVAIEKAAEIKNDIEQKSKELKLEKKNER